MMDSPRSQSLGSSVPDGNEALAVPLMLAVAVLQAVHRDDACVEGVDETDACCPLPAAAVDVRVGWRDHEQRDGNQRDNRHDLSDFTSDDEAEGGFPAANNRVGVTEPLPLFENASVGSTQRARLSGEDDCCYMHGGGGGVRSISQCYYHRGSASSARGAMSSLPSTTQYPVRPTRATEGTLCPSGRQPHAHSQPNAGELAHAHGLGQPLRSDLLFCLNATAEGALSPDVYTKVRRWQLST